jgi:hypothetical protein
MKLQSLMIGSVILTLGVVGVTATGCTATASGGAGTSSGTTSSGGHQIPPDPTGCTTDSTLVCSADAIGVTCSGGASPDSSTLSCSYPDGTDNYCCIEWTAGGDCAPDATLACVYPSYGYSCTSGAAAPDIADPSLVCSTVQPAGGLDTYCCEDNYTGSGSSSGSTGGGCEVDSTLSCGAGEDPISCTGGGDPEAVYPGDICSVPSDQGGGVSGYCCAPGFTGSTCAQDSSVDGCVFPSDGFSCTGADTPDQADPTLNCSAPTTDPNTGDQLYCCE